MFKNRIIEKPEIFFSDGFDHDQYKSEVLSRSKSPLYSSLLWFKEMGAIDDTDIKTFDAIRKHRNEVTHELHSFISDAKKNLDVEKFQELIALFWEIEKWWLINFEMVINPDMVPENIDPEKVILGPIWSLQLMLDIALGNEPKEGYYYNEFTKKHT
ncbi:hypothetical protein CHISP_1216 [Chitinispirillum alkaliphilum]|nr:hypothetical protein CHISP_1216 [Chitinispirillum alkaliphilum]